MSLSGTDSFKIVIKEHKDKFNWDFSILSKKVYTYLTARHKIVQAGMNVGFIDPIALNEKVIAY